MGKQRWSGVLAVVLLGVFAAGCEVEDRETQQQAQVRFVHASTDAPSVDVYLRGQEQPLFTDVDFGEVTDFQTIGAGAQVFEVRPALAPPTSEPVYSAPLVVPQTEEGVTLVGAGLLGTALPEQSFRLLPLQDTALGETAPRVRLVNAVPDLPTLGLDVGADGSVDIAEIPRFQAAPAGGVPVQAGQPLQLSLVAGPPPRPLSRFTVPALAPGERVFLVATGRAGGRPGLSLLSVGAEGRSDVVRSNPEVFLLHASPDAPAVDVFAGDTELVDALGFGGLSGRVRLPPGTTTLDFFEHVGGNLRPAGPPLATQAAPTLVAGERSLLVASGFLSPTSGEPGFSLLPFTAAFPEDPDSMLLRVVHASPDAPAVDVAPLGAGGTVPQAAAFNDIAFTGASAPEGVALSGSPLTVGVAPADAVDRTPVATFEVDPTPFLGRGVFGVATGALTPAADEQGFRLLLVDTSASPWTVTPLAPR